MTSVHPSSQNYMTSGKPIWRSNLICRRRDHIAKIHPSTENESLEVEYSSGRSICTKSIVDGIQSLKSQNSAIFPMCTFVCSKQDDDTLLSDSDQLPCLTGSSDMEPNRPSFVVLNKNHGKNTGDTTLTYNGFQSRDQQVESSLIESYRETLTPNVQLLHEVHVKKGPSCTSVYPILTDRSVDACRFDPVIFDSVEQFGTVENTSFFENPSNEIDLDEKKRLMFRQKMRYDAIKKELFDDSSLTTFDIENDELFDYDDEFQVNVSQTDKVLDKIGCHVETLWNFFPDMSLLFVPTLQEGTLNDGDSTNGGDSVSSTCSSTIEDPSSSSTCKNTYNLYDTLRYKEGNDLQFKSWPVNASDDSSNCESIMDQSHIYLMMTSTRQDKSATEKIKIGAEVLQPEHSTKEYSQKVPDVTILGNYYDISEQISEPGSRIPKSKYDDDESTLTDGSMGWIRHFQRQTNSRNTSPLGKETTENQKRWLKLISQALLGAASLDNPSKKKERCDSANEALNRISKKAIKHR